MPRNKNFSIRKKHLRKCRLFKRPGKEALPGSGSHTEYRNVLDHCPPPAPPKKKFFQMKKMFVILFYKIVQME